MTSFLYLFTVCTLHAFVTSARAATEPTGEGDLNALAVFILDFSAWIRLHWHSPPNYDGTAGFYFVFVLA